MDPADTKAAGGPYLKSNYARHALVTPHECKPFSGSTASAHSLVAAANWQYHKQPVLK